jgi:hypothetical protein
MPEYRIYFKNTWRDARNKDSIHTVSFESDEKALVEYERLVEEAKAKDKMGTFFNMPYKIERIDVKEVTTNITPEASQ